MPQEYRFYKVESFEIIGTYVLNVIFDDGKRVRINFELVLFGELFWPLRDKLLFDRVTIDPDVKTLVWPNGADFNPNALHDWETSGPKLIKAAAKWDLVTV